MNSAVKRDPAYKTKNFLDLAIKQSNSAYYYNFVSISTWQFPDTKKIIYLCCLKTVWSDNLAALWWLRSVCKLCLWIMGEAAGYAC